MKRRRSYFLIAAVWLVVAGVLAAGWRFGVAPMLRADTQRAEAVQRFEDLAGKAAARGIEPPRYGDDATAAEIEALAEQLQQRLTSTRAVGGAIDHRVGLALDSFSGYAVFRSDDFHRRLAERRIAVDLVDDQADYAGRLRSVAAGSTPLAVFTVDALLRTSAASGGQPPATIVMVIDESVGADAVVARQDTTPNVDALNRGDAAVYAVADSPSDLLARVMLANFALPELPADAVRSAESAAAAFARLRQAPSDRPQAVALWEPYVSRALALPGVHTLIDSSRFRGYIVDVLVVQRRFLIDHEPVVRQIVEAYLASAHAAARGPGGWEAMVREDARRLGEPLDAAQAKRLVEGVWWKNTLENFAHFGLLSAEQGGGVATLPRVMSNIRGVLRRTGGLTGAEGEGDGFAAERYFYAGVLESMRAAGYHPAGPVVGAGDREAVRAGGGAAALDDGQWAGLVAVGRVDSGRLVFARGTAGLTGLSRRVLDDLAETLESFPTYYVRVRGHARTVGDAEANRGLARQRAEAARDYLVEVGVPAARLRAVVAEELGRGGEAQSVTFEFGQLPY